ncbi:MAG: hypothetical protein CMK37_07845 [Porticoccaceae bacterium]|nr:hypothetical protein [Porticoccaceae bacterium]|tara:strand:+ start:558 stop:1754 length:1197 start_codon:yes stop_codon:yes gene_type:complete
MSTTCCRYDFSPIEKFETTPEGYLRVWASIARTGIQHYTDADGSIRKEFRPESEVASPESLASFAGKAITMEHPPALLDSENTKDYQIGFTGSEIVYDNGFVRAVMTVTDQEVIDRVMRGDVREVSAGYRVTYDSTPGITDSGEHYDGIQTGISGNHVAIVRRGRAGPQVKLHLDRQDAADPSLFSTEENQTMSAKIVFDGAEFEVSESVALAITKEREDAKMSYEDMKMKYDQLLKEAKDMESKMTAMKEDMQKKEDSSEGRADALQEQLDGLKVELEEAKEINVDSIVADRLALIEKAKPVLDAEYAFVGKADREVMVDAIKAVRGDSVELDERSDDYVLAMFDTIADTAAARADSTEDLRKAVAAAAAPASAPSTYMERLQNAWKTPLSISKEAK